MYANDERLNLPTVLQQSSQRNLTGTVRRWHLLTSDDNGYGFGCSALLTEQEAALYANCTDIVKEQGYDFVDAFYCDAVAENGEYFSHNTKWMMS